MSLKDLKNRVQFTRKKKCDVCKKIKLVANECEDCYNNGFFKSIKQAKKSKIKEICKIIEEYWKNNLPLDLRNTGTADFRLIGSDELKDLLRCIAGGQGR